jgi:two-component system OmpR family response regulator
MYLRPLSRSRQGSDAEGTIMAWVLIIEDDEITARDMIAELSSHGFNTAWAANGRAAMGMIPDGGFDAITLDRMLGDMDGLEIVTALRAAGNNTPVLMISALSDVDERVRGLRAGGDDYLTKPFAPEEMVARLEALLRRRDDAAEDTRLVVDDLELDLLSRIAYRGGQELRLSATEFRLLEYFMRHSHQIVTRTMLFEAVWGYSFDPGTNVVEVHVTRLRKKLEIPGLPPLFQTVRGAGYALGFMSAKHDTV